MSKLIIQIPCYNEEQTLPVTLSALPRQVPGVECVEWLVVSDGSEDATVEVARAHGVDHIISLPHHQGLARAFLTGIEESLRAGADVIVNTDADNQYCADDIPRLVAPVLRQEADIVVGARAIDDVPHFSRTKRLLQRAGSAVIRAVSHSTVADAPSGFRAMSKEAALRLNVFGAYTYTLETIIQAGLEGLAVTSVPVRVNPPLRPSRLVKGVPSYVARSLATILRIFMTYKPLRFFLLLGGVPFMLGSALGARWIYYFLQGSQRTRLPSLVLAAVFVLWGCSSGYWASSPICSP